MKTPGGIPIGHSDTGNPTGRTVPSADIMTKTAKYVKGRKHGKVIDPKGTNDNNCFGWAFLQAGLVKHSSKFWMDAPTQAMLEDYIKLGILSVHQSREELKNGALAIYLDAQDKPVHAGTVSSVGSGKESPTVTARWGNLGIYDTDVSDVLPNYAPAGGQIIFFNVRK
jgi:hypothetical protein